MNPTTTHTPPSGTRRDTAKMPYQPGWNGQPAKMLPEQRLVLAWLGLAKCVVPYALDALLWAIPHLDLNILDDREREILSLRFGLVASDDGVPRSLEEVGEHFSLTRERIRQIEARALSKLREQLRELDQLEGQILAIPQRFQLAVRLADVEGFSYEEIASILDVPIGTVMSRLHRGRKAIYKATKEQQ